MVQGLLLHSHSCFSPKKVFEVLLRRKYVESDIQFQKLIQLLTNHKPNCAFNSSTIMLKLICLFAVTVGIAAAQHVCTMPLINALPDSIACSAVDNCKMALCQCTGGTWQSTSSTCSWVPQTDCGRISTCLANHMSCLEIAATAAIAGSNSACTQWAIAANQDLVQIASGTALNTTHIYESCQYIICDIKNSTIAPATCFPNVATICGFTGSTMSPSSTDTPLGGSTATPLDLSAGSATPVAIGVALVVAMLSVLFA